MATTEQPTIYVPFTHADDQPQPVAVPPLVPPGTATPVDTSDGDAWGEEKRIDSGVGG